MAEVIEPMGLQTKHPSESREPLVHTLDDFLERYLNLLHEYQRLQSDLSKHLSSVCSITAWNVCILSSMLDRVISHWPKPTSQILIEFATVKTIMMNGCRLLARCMVSVEHCDSEMLNLSFI